MLHILCTRRFFFVLVYDSGYIRSAFNLMNLPVYNGTIFSSFFTDQNLTPILNKNQLRSCDENTT